MWKMANAKITRFKPGRASGGAKLAEWEVRAPQERG
jgi:hypothetical protein